MDLQVLGEDGLAAPVIPVVQQVASESAIATESAAPPAATPAASVLSEGISSDDWTIESMERRLVLESLKRTDGNRTKAAEMMGISIRTLFNKLNQYKKKGYDEFDPYLNT